MSLNGLDSDAIVQAHQTAVTEAGGWFLLKYASRDTVKLLANGVGGVNEARSAIESYEEKSPLYGLVHYRRKKFILKYVPEGTSRLLQVRLAVQFQSILDAFVPHDTVFAFTNAEELSESALGLNTVPKSGSKTSSSSSLRQQRLKDIKEDNEEVSNIEVMNPAQTVPSQPTTIANALEDDTSGLPASAVKAKALLAQRRSESQSNATILIQDTTTAKVIEQEPEVIVDGHDNHTPDATRFPPRTTSISTDKALPQPPAEEAGSPVSLSRIVSAYGRPSLDFSIPAVESDSDDDFRRPVLKEFPQIPLSNHLTATESSNISRWTDDVVASTRSKQKRASKPHGDSQVRPKTAGAHEDTVATRRVANLPASVRVSSRLSTQSSRPGSQQSARSMPGRFVPSPSLPPPLPSPTMPTSPERPAPSKARSQASSFTESQAIPPEKLRLMKALQMRKRNQLLAQRSASAGSAPVVAFNSIDSSSSQSSVPIIPQNSVPKQDEPPKHETTDISMTTSPISILTASDTQSTKPSSLSEPSPANHSQTSLSSDTNTSTTPKADSEQKPSTIDDVDPTSEDITEKQETAQQEVAAEVNSSHVLHREAESGLSGLKVGKRRQPFEGRIEIPATTIEPSDVSDDDSFIEEFTVHEAKPMSVNRTPMTPVLSKVPMRENREWTPSSVNGPKSRTPSHSSQVSTPDKRRATSRAGSARSLSTALPQWPPAPSEPVPTLSKQRPQISAGIVTRVKTFESLGQREAAPVQRDPSARVSTFSTMLKRASMLSHSHGGERSDKASNISLPSPPMPDSDDEAEKIDSRPIVQRPRTSTEVHSPTQKGESVTVTARIIRDTTKPHTAHGTSDARHMHWSPLIVERQIVDINARPPLPMTTKSADSLPTNLQDRRRFSFASQKAGTKGFSPTETKSPRLSFTSSHKKPSRAASEASSMTDEKKGSRTSRMLKRLSGLGISRNRPKDAAMTSPTQESLHPKTIAEQRESPDVSMRTVVDIGEMNVQFPETLLWKRRVLRVDDQGYLIFATPIDDASSRGKSRKIHLEEVLKPALPDLEREQITWSIVLALKAGGIVQCACESRNAQELYLKMLVDAHDAYNQLYIN